MIRTLLGRASKPAFAAGAGAASTSTAHCRAPAKTNVEHASPHSPTKLEKNVSVEEGLEGWGYVQFSAPVQKEEVSTALDELAVLGGLRRQASPPLALASGPHIEELGSDGESSTTDGSEANRLLHRADTGDVMFGYDDDFSADPMDNLTGVIGNLLNNPTIMAAIQQELVKDPQFYALMRQVNPGLPGIAQPLLITEITSDIASEDGSEEGSDSGEGGSPMHAFLKNVQRGVCVLAWRVGEACAHLGNFLRRLGENLRTSLEGPPRVEGAGNTLNPQPRHDWESAIAKVAFAVAVIVLAKRVKVFA